MHTDGAAFSDDPDMPVLTFRMFFLGLGFSAFGYGSDYSPILFASFIVFQTPFSAVLAQLYWFKPQSLLVSQGMCSNGLLSPAQSPTNALTGFLLIVTYFVGKAWEKVIPSKGLLKWINPGSFNIKEHGESSLPTQLR